MVSRMWFGNGAWKRKAVLRAAGIAVFAVFFCVGCSFDDEDDVRSSGGSSSGGGGDGGGNNCSTNFRTVTIGTQTWMAENLNCNIQGSVCYNNSADSCLKYGRLYDWSTAKKACPSGWHLPSDVEWRTLTDYVGGLSTAGTKLKSTGGWYDKGNGTDEYEFSALPGGYGIGSNFVNAGNFGSWWSAKEYDAGIAWIRYMYCDDDGVFRDINVKAYLFSVRCVED